MGKCGFTTARTGKSAWILLTCQPARGISLHPCDLRVMHSCMDYRAAGLPGLLREQLHEYRTGVEVGAVGPMHHSRRKSARMRRRGQRGRQLTGRRLWRGRQGDSRRRRRRRRVTDLSQGQRRSLSARRKLGRRRMSRSIRGPSPAGRFLPRAICAVLRSELAGSMRWCAFGRGGDVDLLVECGALNYRSDGKQADRRLYTGQHTVVPE